MEDIEYNKELDVKIPKTFKEREKQGYKILQNCHSYISKNGLIQMTILQKDNKIYELHKYPDNTEKVYLRGILK